MRDDPCAPYWLYGCMCLGSACTGQCPDIEYLCMGYLLPDSHREGHHSLLHVQTALSDVVHD